MPQEYETLRQEQESRSIGSGNSGSKYGDYNAIGTRGYPRDAKDLEWGDRSMGGNGEGVAKAEKPSKLGFVRKVNMIVSLQLIFTMVVSAVCLYSVTLRGLIQENEWTIFAGVGFCFVTLIGLQAFHAAYPTNVYMLTLWTVAVAGTIGVLCATYTTTPVQMRNVLETEGLALFISLMMVLLTLQKTVDVIPLGMVMPIGGLTLILLWGFLLDTFGLKLSYCYAWFGGLLFSFWVGLRTAQDSRVMGSDEAIVGASNLYLHITVGILLMLKTCFIDFVTCRFRGCSPGGDSTEFGHDGVAGDGADGY